MEAIPSSKLVKSSLNLPVGYSFKSNDERADECPSDDKKDIAHGCMLCMGKGGLKSYL